MAVYNLSIREENKMIKNVNRIFMFLKVSVVCSLPTQNCFASIYNLVIYLSLLKVPGNYVSTKDKFTNPLWTLDVLVIPNMQSV